MSARALVTPKTAARLVQLCGMFGSDFDGEVVNAARAAHALVKQLGLQWRDVITAPPEWQHMAFVCRAHAHLLSANERDFIHNISRQRRQPTDRQLAWLEEIYSRVQHLERAA
jgi:hypothetical protein